MSTADIPDELAERRLPDWARKLADIKLGAELVAGVFPHPEWVAQNPGRPFLECPEHLLRVQFGVLGHEHRPAILAGQEDKHTSFTALMLGFVPWTTWRAQMDAGQEPAAEEVAP